MVINLTVEERDKFVAYLKQEATTNIGLAEQMEELGAPHKVIAKNLRIEAEWFAGTARKLESMEFQTIG